MDWGQHLLAALDATPLKISSMPADLKDFIMGHIITALIIGVNRYQKMTLGEKLIFNLIPFRVPTIFLNEIVFHNLIEILGELCF
jgi:hypothetical protein